VARKNFLTIMLQSFISMGVVTVLWVLVATRSRSRNLAVSWQPFLAGSEEWARRRAPMPLISLSGALHLPRVFAIITPALITGAFADRIAFRAISSSSSSGAFSCTYRSCTGSGVAVFS